MDHQLIFNNHIALVKAVNESKSEVEHSFRLAKLHGFRDCLRLIGVTQLIDCDNFYLDQGIDREMCCGVFLDWKPSN